jgi:hypothetical protein
MSTCRWLIGWFVLLSGAALAQDAAELEVDHALTFDFPTPHTAWARPYIQGKTRVLFFTNGRGTMPRHCVELMERFDLDADAIFWTRIVDSTKEHWHGGELGEARMLKLLQKPWDCCVFLGMSPERMSAEAQCRLLEPILDGAGIVLIGADDKRILQKKNQQSVPWLAGIDQAMACKVGKGRGVRLPGIPNIDYYEGWEEDYDLAAERMGRAILWAAGKEAPAQLTIRTEPANLDVEAGWSGRGGTVNVGLTGTATGKLTVSVALRRRGIRDWTLGELTAPCPGALRVPLPEGLAADTYRLDAIARDAKGRSVAWGTQTFRVETRRTVASVTLDDDWAEPGGALVGTARLEGNQPYPDETVVVRLLDPERRVLVRQQVAAAPDVAFALSVEDWLPQLLTVEAVLLSGDREVGRAYTYARVTTRNRSQWNLLFWDTPKGTLAPYAEASLAQHGMTLQLSHGNPPILAAAHNIGWVPYTTRIQAKRNADGIMNPFCWNDKDAVQAHVRKLADKYAGARGHGVFAWSLGDEVDTKGCCLSPHCLAAYRRYLEEQYGKIEALNASWGTTFGTWEDIVLSDPADNEEAASLRAKNYPRWFDRQAFKSWNFVQFCQAYRQAYEAIDPKAKVGFEGAGRFDKGDDIDLIVRNNTFWSPYPGTADEVIRSIAPRDFPRANWMGYTKDADSLLGKFWRMVTRGMDSVWWWRWDCIGRFHGWLAPDLRPFPAVVDILEDTRIVREGLGDLLLKSEMLDDRIAVLYSFPSSVAQSLENGTTYGSYERSHKGAHMIVRELGMQFRYVTDRMLRQGEFDATRYRVLLLPRAEAMSEATAAAVRQFVEQGGTVIADVRPAVFNEHLKPRAKGALDDLFGVSRNGLPAAKVAKDDMLGTATTDPAVSLNGGTAGQVLDGVPVMIAHSVGKGRAILLNFDWSTFPSLALADTDKSLADWALARLAEAGIKPPVRTESNGGARTRHLETIRWQTGQIQIVALFREGGGETEDVTVHLPRPCVVRDLRTGKRLGRGDSFPASIRPNRASWYALLPAPASPVAIQVEPDVTAGTVAPVQVFVPGVRGLHGLRVTVSHQGKTLGHFTRNVVVGAKPVSFVLPMAWNDDPGTYTIAATDRYTGETVKVSFRLRAAPGRPALP